MWFDLAHQPGDEGDVVRLRSPTGRWEGMGEMWFDFAHQPGDEGDGGE